MKTKGRRKVFTCLRRPVDVDDGAVRKQKYMEGNAAGDTVADGVAGGGKESILSSLSEGSKKERPRRGFSRVLKAVLFETSLSKKFGNKKSRDNSLRSGSNSSSKTATVLNSMKRSKASFQDLTDSEDMARNNSSSGSSLFSSSIIDSTSSLSSSSCTSSIASSSRSASERRRPCSIDLKQVNNNNKQASMKEDGVCYFSSIVGLYFLLAGLLVLLIWGKIFAIFCTSLCLFFAPRRSKIIHPRVDMPDIDSEEYKKRVIMEGLLERNRSKAL